MVPDVLVVQSMILLITPYARAQECSEAMEEATAETTQVAENLSDAATRLHAEEYSAVVIDQSLWKQIQMKAKRFCSTSERLSRFM